MLYYRNVAAAIPLFFFFFFIFLSSWGLTCYMRRIALRHSLLDIPNLRSSHSQPTPRGGGLAILLACYLGGAYLLFAGKIAISHIVALGGCGLGIAIIGLLDDLFHLTATRRIIVHFGCALLALNFLPYGSNTLVHLGNGSFSAVMLVLLAVGVVWFINLYNFMDGIDGLAGAEAVSVALGAGFLLYYSGEMGSYFILLLLLGASVLGFLMLNWPPAKIFMGDACSGFLGFFFGTIALFTAQATRMTLWAWFILLGVFVVDSTVTLITRVCQGEKFYEAHRSHTYQILARRLHSHKKVTLAVLAVNVLWLLPCAFISISWPSYGLLCTIVSYMPLVLASVMVGAGTINE
ncbi:MAG: Fuc2NAc and GlcNAc [Desulfobulbaceae bacterium]|nr:MAG: Fuc2NAc and GlcNAc [Desulfobulbaceae bacterium]